jgi:hypothetical protein
MGIHHRIFDGLTRADLLRLAETEWMSLNWSKAGFVHVARYGAREYEIIRIDKGYRTVVRTSGVSQVLGRPIRVLSDAKGRCEIHNALSIERTL